MRNYITKFIYTWIWALNLNICATTKFQIKKLKWSQATSTTQSQTKQMRILSAGKHLHLRFPRIPTDLLLPNPSLQPECTTPLGEEAS